MKIVFYIFFFSYVLCIFAQEYEIELSAGAIPATPLQTISILVAGVKVPKTSIEMDSEEIKFFPSIEKYIRLSNHNQKIIENLSIKIDLDLKKISKFTTFKIDFNTNSNPTQVINVNPNDKKISLNEFKLNDFKRSSATPLKVIDKIHSFGDHMLNIINTNGLTIKLKIEHTPNGVFFDKEGFHFEYNSEEKKLFFVSKYEEPISRSDMMPFRGTWKNIISYLEGKNKDPYSKLILPSEKQWVAIYKDPQILENFRNIQGRLSGARDANDNLIEKFEDYYTISQNRKADEATLEDSLTKLESFVIKKSFSPITEIFPNKIAQISGNVAEWTQNQGLVVARSTDNIFHKGLEPNFEILKVFDIEIKDLDYFWKLVEKHDNVSLFIKTDKGVEKNITIQEKLTHQKLLLTDRILKGGSCLDPKPMLYPEARTLVVYGDNLEKYDYTQPQSNSDAKIQSLRDSGFAITVMDELLEALQKDATNEEKKELTEDRLYPAGIRAIYTFTHE
jgi:hypothetical protein